MMKELTSMALQVMRDAGAQKAQCVVSTSEKQEFNVEKNEYTLFRSTFNSSLGLTALLDGKKASLSINQFDEDSIREAAAAVVDMSRNSQPDEANDIAGLEDGPSEYDEGSKGCDRGLMFDRVGELLEKVKSEYPTVTIVDGQTDFTRSASFVHNTNGVEIAYSNGYYGSSFSFGAKDGETATSINGGGGYMYNLDKPLWDCFGLGMMIAQSVEELKARQLKNKFSGRVILSPFFMTEFLSMYIGCYLGDRPLISRTSALKDSLGKKAASELLTVMSDPGDRAVVANPVTSDGFRAKKMTIFDRGVLSSFVLSQYGANKIGGTRSANLGAQAGVAPGDTELKELIGMVDRGLMIGRFSGGMPSDNGDFSGIAKNSFYIENGKIAYPVTETMISGNLRAMFENVTGISTETVSFGADIQPWVLVDDVGISGS